MQSKRETRYLNTDLDLFSPNELTLLASGLEERGMGIHHVGLDDGTWCAHLDMLNSYDTPELTIEAMLDIIETLPEQLKVLWHGCARREFNIGYDCGEQPRSLEQALSDRLITRIAAVRAGIGLTLYAATR